jgi:hypothetical protein
MMGLRCASPSDSIVDAKTEMIGIMGIGAELKKE